MCKTEVPVSLKRSTKVGRGRKDGAFTTPSKDSVIGYSVTGDFAPLEGKVYFGGYIAMLLHFACINVGLISAKGIMGTGTTTVLSWMNGWLIRYYFTVHRRSVEKGGRRVVRVPRALRYELLLLLAQLFVLAVGAGAFSRYYFGWIASRDDDLFQSLSLKYLTDLNLPTFIDSWWRVSATTRFTGFGWWICEMCDLMCHQMPFVMMMYFTYTSPALRNITADINPGLLLLVVLVGPAQRYFWDMSTCGTIICDGPYHGFLNQVAPIEQIFWHSAPGLLFCTGLFWRFLCGHKEEPQVFSKKVVGEFEGVYSVTKTLTAVVLWGLSQVLIAYAMGGELTWGL